MSVLKYLEEKDADDSQHPAGPRQWAACLGHDPLSYFPFRGQAGVTLRKGEEHRIQVQVDFECRNFDLTSGEDLAAYKQIKDKISNGLYVQVDRLVWTDPATGARKIYLEWCDRYNTVAGSKAPKPMEG